MKTLAPSRRILETLRDRRGVAALEFAMIAPVMIVMFFGIAELGQGLIAERRVSHATSALGDLAAQGQSIGASSADDMFAASTDIMAPLPANPLKLRVSSVTGDSKGKPKVDWSYVSAGSGLSAYGDCTSPPTLPAGLVTAAGETVILSEAQYQFTSPVGYILPSGIAFTRSSYLRPRYGQVSRTSPAKASCG